MQPSLAPWMALDYGAPPVETDLPSQGPQRGLLVYLAATVRGRLEGAAEVLDITRIVPRVRRAAWALEVAGVGLYRDPVGVLEWLDLTADGEVQTQPWHRWSPGEEVPPDARSLAACCRAPLPGDDDIGLPSLPPTFQQQLDRIPAMRFLVEESPVFSEA